MSDWQKERAWQQDRADAELDRTADAYARLYALISATGYVPTERIREQPAATGMGLVVDKLTQRMYVFRDGKLLRDYTISDIRSYLNK